MKLKLKMFVAYIESNNYNKHATEFVGTFSTEKRVATALALSLASRLMIKIHPDAPTHFLHHIYPDDPCSNEQIAELKEFRKKILNQQLTLTDLDHLVRGYNDSYFKDRWDYNVHEKSIDSHEDLSHYVYHFNIKMLEKLRKKYSWTKDQACVALLYNTDLEKILWLVKTFDLTVTDVCANNNKIIRNAVDQSLLDKVAWIIWYFGLSDDFKDIDVEDCKRTQVIYKVKKLERNKMVKAAVTE